MNFSNNWVVPVLKDFTKLVSDDQRYFCIGSVSLLSFTKEFYNREIKDIDIICDVLNFEIIRNGLKKFGYKQYTFINKKFPFYKQLFKLSKSKYFRFEKNGRNLEIMTSDFGHSKNEISIEMYPKVAFNFPSIGVIDSSFNGSHFKAVSPETLYCIYSFGLKTWGRFTRTKIDQRKNDLKQLEKIINKNKLKQIASNIFLKIGPLKVKIPANFIL